MIKHMPNVFANLFCFIKITKMILLTNESKIKNILNKKAGFIFIPFKPSFVYMDASHCNCYILDEL